MLEIDKIILENIKITKDGKIFNIKKDKEYSQWISRGGYYRVSLYNKGKGKKYFVHRLVAYKFLNIDLEYDGKNLVNHIDGNKKNNKLKNLEIVSQSENTKHAHRNNLINQYKLKVKQLSLKGDLIKIHNSIKHAAISLNIPHLRSKISAVCKGKRKKCNGFKWEYLKKENKILTDIKNFKKISNFEDYLIDKNGNIYSLKSKKILKKRIDEKGYYKIGLRKNNKIYTKQIHILVMETYSNEIKKENYVINHIDHDKTNNNFENLEYVSMSENSKKAIEFHGKSFGIEKMVLQIDKNTDKILNKYNTIKDASIKTGIYKSGIQKCCSKKYKQKSAGGFKWNFKSY